MCISKSKQMSPLEVAHDLQLFWFRYDCYKESYYEAKYVIDTRKKISQNTPK